MADSYVWTFNTSDTDNADLKQRSSVFSYKQVNAVYNDLDPKLDYVLAMTYSTDHVYKRVQSLEADGVQLHGPMPLPNGKSIRVIVNVPRSVTEDGKMALAIKIHGEVNATASIIELWSSAPLAASALRLALRSHEVSPHTITASASSEKISFVLTNSPPITCRACRSSRSVAYGSRRSPPNSHRAG